AFCGSGGTVGLFPARFAIKARIALQFAPRSQLSLFHTLRGDTALWKKSAAETCTAHIERGQMYGLVPPPKNDFGRSASNVNHKPAMRRRGQFVRDPGIDQTGFLGSGNDFYGETQCGFGARENIRSVAGDAKRVGRNCPYPIGMKALQPFSVTLEHCQGALNSGFVKDLMGIEPGSQLN